MYCLSATEPVFINSTASPQIMRTGSRHSAKTPALLDYVKIIDNLYQARDFLVGKRYFDFLPKKIETMADFLTSIDAFVQADLSVIDQALALNKKVLTLARSSPEYNAVMDELVNCNEDIASLMALVNNLYRELDAVKKTLNLK